MWIAWRGGDTFRLEVQAKHATTPQKLITAERK
jgi:hypothetical protein